MQIDDVSQLKKLDALVSDIALAEPRRGSTYDQVEIPMYPSKYYDMNKIVDSMLESTITDNYS
ncbi:hypothetical protein J6590_070334 [Homalodisca vitripennis]|nr:hypothetical protein J6590_070334 [Homalodisca vitripennis]